MKILVDVDNILCDSNAHFRREFNKKGIPWPKAKYTWVTGKDFGLTEEEMVDVFDLVHSSEGLTHVEPYKGSQESLAKIKEEFSSEKIKCDIWYVSNRNPANEEPLRQWLKFHSYVDSENTNTSFDKRKWIQQERPFFVIDDRVKTLVYSRYEVGSICYGLKHTWNVNLANGEIPGIYILDTWEEIADHIVQKLWA